MVRAIMIVEMAGQPATHVQDMLKAHIEVLRKVNDIKVHEITVSQPKEIETNKGIYTCFAEADFETTNFARLSETVFDFMPSSVEVLEPGKVTMDITEANNLLNNISGRLHRYDEIAKIAHYRIKQLSKELRKHLGQEELPKLGEEQTETTTEEQPNKKETREQTPKKEKKTKKKKK